MRITGVTVTPVRIDETKPKSWLSESLVANPMSIYPEYKARRSSWGAKWGPELLVRIQTDEGIEGHRLRGSGRGADRSSRTTSATC